MNVHWFQHVDFEGLGVIADWAEERGHNLTSTPWFQPDVSSPDLSEADLLIIFGGPMGVNDEVEYPWLIKEKEVIKQAIGDGKRIFAVCLGAQLVASVLGADVTKNAHLEIGWSPVTRTQEMDSPLVSAFPDEFQALHWHGETFAMPENATPLGSSNACANQGFAVSSQILALQCHLEIGATTMASLLEAGHIGGTSGPYVQSEEDLLQGTIDYEAASRALLFKILDTLVS